LFLVVAGLVEGLFSPALLPPPLKFAVAALLSIAFWSYICWRDAEDPAEDVTDESAP